MGFVCDINSRIVQIPPLLDKNQQLDESKLAGSLAKKAPRSYKDMLFCQGFKPETGDMVTFVEHCTQAKNTDNISAAKFSVSGKYSDNKRKKAFLV